MCVYHAFVGEKCSGQWPQVDWDCVIHKLLCWDVVIALSFQSIICTRAALLSPCCDRSLTQCPVTRWVKFCYCQSGELLSWASSRVGKVGRRGGGRGVKSWVTQWRPGVSCIVHCTTLTHFTDHLELESLSCSAPPPPAAPAGHHRCRQLLVSSLGQSPPRPVSPKDLEFSYFGVNAFVDFQLACCAEKWILACLSAFFIWYSTFQSCYKKMKSDGDYFRILCAPMLVIVISYGLLRI